MNRRQIVPGVTCALIAASTGVLGAAPKITTTCFRQPKTSLRVST